MIQVFFLLCLSISRLCFSVELDIVIQSICTSNTVTRSIAACNTNNTDDTDSSTGSIGCPSIPQSPTSCDALTYQEFSKAQKCGRVFGCFETQS
jgi:hypothetical protein